LNPRPSVPQTDALAKLSHVPRRTNLIAATCSHLLITRRAIATRRYVAIMPAGHRYTRDELAAAVASARSWRGVLRALGRPATSAGSRRAVQRQVDAFGIDHSHFTGQRRWSDRQLVDAVEAARTWPEVLLRLKLADADGNRRTVRAHATRLGVDLSHLHTIRTSSAPPRVGEPDPKFLRIAGAALAASWFMLRGCEVLWPLEPCRYDLAVSSGGMIQRVQVKTATFRNDGTFVATLSNSRRAGRVVYDVDEIDRFFVIDGQLNAYLIPFADVSGYQAIYLRNYRAFLVGERGNWLDEPKP
jgi:hypothetical protein